MAVWPRSVLLFRLFQKRPAADKQRNKSTRRSHKSLASSLSSTTYPQNTSKSSSQTTNHSSNMVQQTTIAVYLHSGQLFSVDGQFIVKEPFMSSHNVQHPHNLGITQWPVQRPKSQEYQRTWNPSLWHIGPAVIKRATIEIRQPKRHQLREFGHQK